MLGQAIQSQKFMVGRPSSAGEVARIFECLAIILEESPYMEVWEHGTHVALWARCLQWRECSASEVHTSTPLESPNLASPSRLHTDSVASYSWSILECFLDCCGKHYSKEIEYTVKSEEWEKARKMAADKGPRAEYISPVLDSILLTELFPEMCLRACGPAVGIARACASAACHSLGARDQTVFLTCKKTGMTLWDCILVVDLDREREGNEGL